MKEKRVNTVTTTSMTCNRETIKSSLLFHASQHLQSWLD
jgi:hypothetical protein